MSRKQIPGVGSTGLDDGPYLPGRAPRKKTTPKTPEELREIRTKACDARRVKYGQKGAQLNERQRSNSTMERTACGEDRQRRSAS